MKTGDCYQLGAVVEGAGWEAQPPLVYVLSPAVNGLVPVVFTNGHREMVEAAVLTEYRGNVHAKDLARFLAKKGKRRPV